MKITIIQKITAYIFTIFYICACGGGGDNPSVSNNGNNNQIAATNTVASETVSKPIIPANTATILASPPSVMPMAVVTPSITVEQQTHLDALNQHRKINGELPLVLNNKLIQSAQAYAENMLKTGRFDHVGANGSTFETRITAAGYNYRSLGENIALGQLSVAQVMNDWKKSPTHNENMLRRSFTEVGLGHAGNYWVQHFGSPAR
jgi:uncharacterized protein YkwD